MVAGTGFLLTVFYILASFAAMEKRHGKEFSVMETVRQMRLPEDVDAADNVLLLTARQAASICGMSLRTWRSWDAAGWIPRPVRIGRSTLWRADELREWVAAGCPRRDEWETRQ